jgi:hypothetical protein
MHAGFEERVSDRNRDIAPRGEPADPHHVGHVLRMSAPPASSSCRLPSASHARDLVFGGKRMEQGLDKAQSHLAGIGNELEGRYIDRIGTDLTVPDGAVASELKAGDAEL